MAASGRFAWTPRRARSRSSRRIWTAARLKKSRVVAGHVLECAQQAHEAVLEDVFGVGDAADVGESVRHAAGEFFEPAEREAEEFVGRGAVAGLPAVNTPLHRDRVEGRIGHRQIPGPGEGRRAILPREVPRAYAASHHV